MDPARCAAVVLAAVLAACSGADATPMVRARAADDLVCAEATIKVVRGMDGNYTAVGCGKRAKYTALCEGTRCSVAREGDSLQSPPPLAPPPEQPAGY